MIIERSSAARGATDFGWLQSKHTFSFGNYHDPEWMGFGPLRVVNDDRVGPGGGFAPHQHANMEIISVVLDGALAHKDNKGNAGVIRAGDVQWMSAGHGIEHSEYNDSDAQSVHFLQLWIQPDRLNAQPAYGQRHFDPESRRARWAVLISPDGEAESLAIRQQAWLRASQLHAEDHVEMVLDPSRRYWLHVAIGEIRLGERVLKAGDALGFIDEASTINIEGMGESSDVLLFDLPA